MKTVLSITDNRARDEVKKYAYVSLGAALISLVMLWFIAIIGLALGARAFVLTFHKANATRPDLLKLRMMSGMAFVLSCASYGFHLAG